MFDTIRGIRKITPNSPIKSVWFIGNGFDLACGLKTGYPDFFGILRDEKGSFVFADGCPVIQKDGYLSDKPYDNPEIIKFKKQIKEEIKPDKNLWADIEIRLGQITKCYDKNEDGIKNFLDCFNDLHTHLNEYLKKIEENSINSKDVKKRWYDIYKKCFKNVNIETTVFLIMNYTDNFEKFLKEIYSDYGYTEDFIISRLVYVHGKLSKNNTVFGVGSPMHIGNNYFMFKPNFREKFVKTLITNSYSRLNLHNLDLLDIKSKGLNVNIFGCSMGESDTMFWGMIFNMSIFEKITFRFMFGIKKICSPKITLYNRVFENKKDYEEKLKYFNDNLSEVRKWMYNKDMLFERYANFSSKIKFMLPCVLDFTPFYFYFLTLVLKLFGQNITPKWMYKMLTRKIDNEVELVNTGYIPEKTEIYVSSNTYGETFRYSFNYKS